MARVIQEVLSPGDDAILNHGLATTRLERRRRKTGGFVEYNSTEAEKLTASLRKRYGTNEVQKAVVRRWCSAAHNDTRFAK